MTKVSWAVTALKSKKTGSWPAVFLQPLDPAGYEELAARLQPAGLIPSTSRMQRLGRWPVSRCTVTVAGSALTEANTGLARLHCRPLIELPAPWLAAAAERQVVLGLALPELNADQALADSMGMPLAELRTNMLIAGVTTGRTLVGLADVRSEPEPPGWRR